MLKPIHIRTNYMQSQTPFYAGYLLPDNRNAIYISQGIVNMVPVVPFAYDGLYAQDDEITLIAYVPYVRDDPDDALIAALYSRLRNMSAFELLTKCYNKEADAYLVIDDRDDHEDYEDPPYDEYGRTGARL